MRHDFTESNTFSFEKKYFFVGKRSKNARFTQLTSGILGLFGPTCFATSRSNVSHAHRRHLVLSDA